jgi:hypothetical protein
MQKQTANTNVNVLEAGDPASVESVAVEMVTCKLLIHSFDAANFQHLSDMCYSMFLPVRDDREVHLITCIPLLFLAVFDQVSV